MLKKYLIAFLVFCILALALFVIRGSEDAWLCVNGEWIKHGNPSSPMPTTGCVPPANANDNTGLANPASTNCIDRGGELTIKKDDTGGESGVCSFKDGSECEEWALFREECQPGIKVVSPVKDEQITSPLIITGTARGGWFFEASFPVKLVDENDQLIAETTAQAGGDWMTEDYVPFTAELTFATSTTPKGYLILKNDNPSGLPENEVTLKIPVILPTGETQKVKVFFNNNELDPAVSCNQVFPVERSIAKTEAVARAALEELLKGPSQADSEYGYYSGIPQGVKIQKLTIENGVAKVDFDATLEKNIGGSCRVSSIYIQIVETLRQFPTVKSVIVSIDGRTEDILQP